MRERGLVINDPSGSVTLAVPVVDRIDALPLAPGDVVVLAMKTQDTPGALDALRAHAPSGVAVACAQNGVENERLALRLFEHVYGICVMLPATLLEPGIVDASGQPHNAILDVGRYPAGVDANAEALAAAFEASGLSSRPSADVMRFKYRKLLMNLANSLDALVVAGDDTAEIYTRARAEAEACFAAAGIDAASDVEDRARRDGVMKLAPIDGRPRGGGSTWQSLARGATSTEIDWLNGEIVLLGREHGVATPVNAMLQEVTRAAAAAGTAPRSVAAAELLARLG